MNFFRLAIPNYVDVVGPPHLQDVLLSGKASQKVSQEVGNLTKSETKQSNNKSKLTRQPAS